jgi:alkyl hydroperoxide reductase subunit AhpC
MAGKQSKVYMVLGLSIDDAVQLDEWDSEEASSTKYQDIFARLTEDEREALAQAMADQMWDGDRWEYELRLELDNLASGR